MAILISQKNAASTASSAAALTAYTFNAAAANSSSLNMFFGLSDVKETLNYNGGNLKVADVSTGDIFNITDTAPATVIDVYKSGNSVIVTNNAKTYTFGSVADTESFVVTFGTGAKSITVARSGDAITWNYTVVNGNVASTLSTVGVTPIDAVAPTATATALYTNTPNAPANAVVQSTEIGTAFLVKNTLAVTAATNLITLEAANGSSVNSVAIATANTSTNLAASGLDDGVYNVYTTDRAGNVSAAASAAVTIVTATNGTIGNPVNTQTGWKDIINGNQGSVTGAVSFDATGGDDTYVISTKSGANIVINGFTASADKLVFDIGSFGTPATFAGAAPTGYYNFSDNGTNTTLTHNADGVIQSITLMGVTHGTPPATINTLTQLTTFFTGTTTIGYNALYVASPTTISTIFHAAGTVGLYDSAGVVLANVTTQTLTANTASTLTVAAQTAITTATLKVIDAAGLVQESANVILGTGGAALTGTAGNEYIFSFGGADAINGSGGDDTITGGGAVDTITVAAGRVTLTDLGNAHDELIVSAGATVDATVFLSGGAGTWTPTGASSNAGTINITAGMTATASAVDLTSIVNTSGTINLNASTSTFASTLTGTIAGTVNITGSAATGIANTIVLPSGTEHGLITAGKGIDTLSVVTTGEVKIAETGGTSLAVTVSGSTISNIVTTTALAATTITGGTGIDTIKLSDTVSNSATIIGGTGVDVIDLGANHTGGVTFTATAENIPVIDTAIDAAISHYVKNIDKIGATSLILGTQTAAAASGVATITNGVATFNAADTTAIQHLAAVAAALQTTAGATAIWQEGADAYVYIADATLAVANTDVLIKLVGTTAGALTIGTNEITSIA